MKKFKTAFITFFPVSPNNMGSSTVVNSRFESWPGNKKLFQLSHIKNINNKLIKTIFLKKENPLNKIISLPKLINQIFNYIKNSKNKILVIEGASWIFYSFIVIFFIRILVNNLKIIYISHSIESEVRKKFSNIFIYLITRYLEKLVFKNSDIVTSVSNVERYKIKKIYNKKTILFPNAINLKRKFLKKKLRNNYIIYTGSYSYKPNKEAIDYLNNVIMPKIIEDFPKEKLILTGGGFKKKYPWLINKGLVSKKNLYNLIYNSHCMCVPLKFGSGTRIKIIEALSLGAIVVSSSKGIEGIVLTKKNPPYIVNNTNKLIKTIKNTIKYNKKIKAKSLKNKKYYLKKYSMKKNTLSFLKSVDLK